MDEFASIVEKRIQEAMKRGEFENLPGAGRPLCLKEDPLVPKDQRLAYKILKNAGYIPPEMELKREIHSLMKLISETDEGAGHSVPGGHSMPGGRLESLRELNFKLLKFNTLMKRPLNTADFPNYEERVHEKLARAGRR